MIALLNPNTCATVTDLMATAAKSWLAGRAKLLTVTAPFGSSALRNAQDITIAEQAVLRMVDELPPVDTIIIGAFGDPGLQLARRRAAAPVYGIGEAGLLAAASYGAFSILTLGRSHAHSIHQRVMQMDLTDRMVGLDFLDADIPAVAAEPTRFLDDVRKVAVRETARGARALLLGGAPFSGLASQIAGDVPVLDGLTCALQVVLRDGELREAPCPRGIATLF